MDLISNPSEYFEKSCTGADSPIGVGVYVGELLAVKEVSIHEDPTKTQESVEQLEQEVNHSRLLKSYHTRPTMRYHNAIIPFTVRTNAQFRPARIIMLPLDSYKKKKVGYPSQKPKKNYRYIGRRSAGEHISPQRYDILTNVTSFKYMTQ